MEDRTMITMEQIASLTVEERNLYEVGYLHGLRKAREIMDKTGPKSVKISGNGKNT